MINRIQPALGTRVRKAAPWINPNIPGAANLVRAWSLRRLVSAYQGGYALRELRANGGAETDVPFKRGGGVEIAGTDAWANAWYDQKGAADSKLINSTFANCPVVREGGSTQAGLRFNSGRALAMAQADTALATLFGDLASGYSVAFWVMSNDVASDSIFLERRHPDQGHLGFKFLSGALHVRVRESTWRASGNVSANVWIHVVLTVQKTGVVDQRLVYVNAGTPASRTVADPGAVTSFPLQVSCPTSAVLTLNDLAIWNRVLTASEVTALHNATCGYYGVATR